MKSARRSPLRFDNRGAPRGVLEQLEGDSLGRLVPVPRKNWQIEPLNCAIATNEMSAKKRSLHLSGTRLRSVGGQFVPCHLGGNRRMVPLVVDDNFPGGILIRPKFFPLRPSRLKTVRIFGIGANSSARKASRDGFGRHIQSASR